MGKKFKKKVRNAKKSKPMKIENDVDMNLPVNDEDDFNITDMIEELDPDEFLFNPKKSGKKRKLQAKDKNKSEEPDKKILKKENIKKSKEKKTVNDKIKDENDQDSEIDEEDGFIVSEKINEEDVEEPKKKGKKPGVVDPSTLGLDMSAWDKFYLPSEVLEGLKKMRYVKPTEIQEDVIPEAVTKRLDILGAAETGSGKTMAFCIPIATRLLQSEDKDGLRALILAPTRELVIQIKNEMEKLLEFTKFTVIPIIGGLNEQKQERLLSWKPQIIVATPGRFWALSETNDYLKKLDKLDFLIIDEMDRMVETGHFVEMEKILLRIHSVENKSLQTMVFSATLSYVHLPAYRPGKKIEKLTKEDKIERLVKIGGLKSKHKIIDLNPDISTPKTLKEMRINCDDLLDKDTKIYYLLNRHRGRTLIFTNSIDASKRLSNLLKTLQIEPLPQVLHAKLQQRARLKHLERFSNTENSILIATDVAARGLDIKGIENVIHYQIPRTAENYIHRSGRTARISNNGISILMVDPKEIMLYRRICSNLNRETDFPSFYIDSDKLYQSCKNRVEAATRVEQIDFQLSKYIGEKTWENKAGSEALIDVKGITEDEQEEIQSLQRQRKAAAKALKSMLNQSLSLNVPNESLIKQNVKNEKQVRLWGANKKR